MEVTKSCMRVFFLTVFQEFFQLKPCKIDAQRVHEFMTTLQENGTCKITVKDGGVEEALITSEIVIQDLHLLEGNHQVGTMKLSL